MLISIFILFALAVGILILIAKGWRDGQKEPTKGTIKYYPDGYHDDYPVYDEKYLKECIEKATPRLKNVNVQEFMDEMRGREPKGTDEYERINKEIDDFLKARELRRKLNKIEEERNIDKNFMR